MPDNSFDVVSKIELPEVSNAVQQAVKEIQQRYDLKDSHSSIHLNEKENKLLLASADEFKLKAVVEILEQKLVKRKVPLKGLVHGTVTPAAGSSVRQEITLNKASPSRRRGKSLRSSRTARRKSRRRFKAISCASPPRTATRFRK
jgi:uncharacterized protein YajQ (UPF0234 family)